MKTAVALLEPHMEKSDASGKGRIVLATVRGDVHDIGKNLVDIILTNNGYDVVNLGIKQPIADIIAAAEEHNADVIGMSGLLVKSTVVMKENLHELQSRGLAERWPVILGGAALTRAYVEDDLAGQFDGDVRYARDAFEGLTLMEPLVRIARGASPDEVGLPPLKKRIHRAGAQLTLTEPEAMPGALRRGLRQPRAGAAVLGHPHRRGASRSPTTPRSSTSARRSWGSGGSSPAAARTASRTSSSSSSRAVRACGTGSTASSPRGCSTPRSRTATSRWCPRATTWSSCTTATTRPASSGRQGCSPRTAARAARSGTERLRFHFPRQRRDRHLCLVGLRALAASRAQSTCCRSSS